MLHTRWRLLLVSLNINIHLNTLLNSSIEIFFDGKGIQKIDLTQITH